MERRSLAKNVGNAVGRNGHKGDHREEADNRHEEDDDRQRGRPQTRRPEQDGLGRSYALRP